MPMQTRADLSVGTRASRTFSQRGAAARRTVVWGRLVVSRRTEGGRRWGSEGCEELRTGRCGLKLTLGSVLPGVLSGLLVGGDLAVDGVRSNDPGDLDGADPGTILAAELAPAPIVPGGVTPSVCVLGSESAARRLGPWSSSSDDRSSTSSPSSRRRDETRLICFLSAR